ncbi:MAG: right-handed parallel beta-helix repeat-containing protein [Myxococcota bacterium]
MLATASTVKAYDGERVILTPQDPRSSGTDVIRLPSGKFYIIFDGLVLDGLLSGGTNGGRMGFRFADGTINGESVNPSHHIRLINMVIRNNYHSSILTTDAHHLEFINTELDNSHNYGIYMSSGDNLMLGCDIHDHNGYGIHNYSAHTYKPNNNRFFGNRLYNNGKSGIVIAQGTGVRFFNNISYNNGTGGTDLYTGADRYGIHVNLGVSNVTLYNNTTYNNAKGELRIGDSASNIAVRNNIFLGTNPTDHTIHVLALSGSQTPATLTNNLIYHANPSFYLLNQGAAEVSNNILGQNPSFVNTNNHDFRLAGGSPAIDAGTPLSEVTEDFVGTPRDPTAPDLGAFEFSGSTSVGPDPPSLARFEHLTGTSDNFDPGSGPEKLWDTCTEDEVTCTAGAAGITSFWLEFDFGELHRLSSARLFGDDLRDWRSQSWSLFYKVTEHQAWSQAFIADNALLSDWVSADLAVLARYVRVEVNGIETGTQARELEIHGVPETCTTSTEQCDGEDNNCDGAVDEDWPTLGNACITGLGACAQEGVLICDADGQGAVCSAVGLSPSDEVCDDGIDNDCDGGIDEDCPGSACPENYVVINPDEALSNELTVVGNDADGNPVTCGRVAFNREALGCASSGGTSLGVGFLLLGVLWVVRRRSA